MFFVWEYLAVLTLSAYSCLFAAYRFYLFSSHAPLFLHFPLRCLMFPMIPMTGVSTPPIQKRSHFGEGATTMTTKMTTKMPRAIPPQAANSSLIELSRRKGYCMKNFCLVARLTEIRVRACTDPTCVRLLPALHKNIVDTPDTHAPNGWFIALPARKGSRVRDGLFVSYLTEEQYQSGLQRRSDQNIAAGQALRH